jgi:type 2 lantibiotic biosynthesis protein LanM
VLPVDPATSDRLVARAVTVDELLSDDFETLPGQKGDSDLAARRLTAWCKSAASGQWPLFGRRLQRDELAHDQVLGRFATARRRDSVPPPDWAEDAAWIYTALGGGPGEPGRYPFGALFAGLIADAEKRVWATVGERTARRLSSSARDCLRQLLLKNLCDLCAPGLYERFDAARAADRNGCYDRFIGEMAGGGFRRLLHEKPVLLRLITSTTRQWLATTREFVLRLDVDAREVRREILGAGDDVPVARVDGGLSDPHHGGRTVLAVEFEDGLRVMYKPKDVRVDAAWHALVERLNKHAPQELRAARTITRDGYGWTEFIAHTGCADVQGCQRFFRRAGGWLALFYCFAGSDIHQENLIASGEHPVPVDLESILQASDGQTDTGESQAFKAASEMIADSVIAVGLLPAYGRSAADDVYAVGGVAGDWTAGTALEWSHLNSDTIRPAMVQQDDRAATNLPHIDGRQAPLGDHIDDFISGFREYATFLWSSSRDTELGGLFDGFAGLPVRKVVRPTQFYSMLLHRLKDDRTMDDGAVWSAQADFLARLADWDHDTDPAWPLQRAERSALIELNVPHFVMLTDGTEIHAGHGVTVRTHATSGLERARHRVESLDEHEITWQVDVMRQTATFVSRPSDEESRRLVPTEPTLVPTRDIFVAEADAIAADISRHAIRRGGSAAWVGLGWFTDSDVSQLAVLGPDLYNGGGGIALFLAAHAAVTQQPSSAELALAAVAHLRAGLHGGSASHRARLLGIGAATGLGSVVYTLTAMSRLLRDESLLTDAHRAAALISEDLIAADKRLDVIGGSAGAILCLLRLYEDTRASDVLDRAVGCGAHLLTQERAGPVGRRSWRGHGPDPQVLNGMSHGAAGFAYALSALTAATGREDFAAAATECLEFERANYDAERADWPDYRVAEPHWRSQWCHGAVGIGLARIGMTKRGFPGSEALTADIRNALDGAARGWPGHVDTLCCGSLGSVELVREAGAVLRRGELRQTATKRLAAVLDGKATNGDYRWNGGERCFNVGLFRGLAGAGYACLREIDSSAPNVLIWE